MGDSCLYLKCWIGVYDFGLLSKEGLVTTRWDRRYTIREGNGRGKDVKARVRFS